MAIADWTISLAGSGTLVTTVYGTWSQEGNPGGCFKGFISQAIPSGDFASAAITRTVDIPTGYTKVLMQLDAYSHGNRVKVDIAGVGVLSWTLPSADTWLTSSPVDITSAIAGASQVSVEAVVHFPAGAVVTAYGLIDNIKLIGVI